MPQPSILDERLAEIDRRLLSIQTGLRPVGSLDGMPTFDERDATSEADAADAPDAVPDDPEARDAGAPDRARSPGADPDGPKSLSPPTRLRRVGPSDPASGQARGPGPTPVEDLRELTRAHERLLEIHRELLSHYAELLQRRADAATTVELTAGPFTTAAAVRAFERSLTRLPGVAGVSVREYRQGDRVQVDVDLVG